MAKRLFIFTLTLFCLALAIIFALRTVIIAKARDKADVIAPYSPDTKKYIEDLTASIHEIYIENSWDHLVLGAF